MRRSLLRRGDRSKEKLATQKKAGKKTPSLHWTDVLTNVFIEYMVEEAQVSMADVGSKQFWNKLIFYVNTGEASELVKQGLNEVSKAQL
jgi:hypothetical protein